VASSRRRAVNPSTLLYISRGLRALLRFLRGSVFTLSRDAISKTNAQTISYAPDDLSTTENSMVTSSELPKQIPAPPSKVRGRVLMAQTTPVQRYALRRTDILPGYGFGEE
jgi:hypothetical protein